MPWPVVMVGPARVAVGLIGIHPCPILPSVGLFCVVIVSMPKRNRGPAMGWLRFDGGWALMCPRRADGWPVGWA